MENKNSEFSDRLSQIRIKAKPYLSRKKLADEASVSENSIKAWENGKDRPRPTNLQSIIKVLYENGAFTKGEEEKEIIDLWKKAKFGVSFDDSWFENIRNSPPLPPNSVDKIESKEDEKSAESQNSQPMPAFSGEGLQALEVFGRLVNRFFLGNYMQDEDDRTAFLKRVERLCNDDLLAPSLEGDVHITMDLSTEPDAVSHPLQQNKWQAEHLAKVHPAGTTIEKIYDAATDGLLILGGPGSGKTNLLLELTSVLLQDAKNDQKCKMPIICNLSSWTLKRVALADWIVEELNTKYAIPRKIGKFWIANNKLILLLDGLDEVVTSQRSACVDAINAYRQEHGTASIVVCCRKEEYEMQETRLHFRDAVSIVPLSAQKINGYLSASSDLAAVKAALDNDPQLLELLSAPLMLNIVVRTYRGQSVEDLLAKNKLDERRRQILKAYIKRMLRKWSPDEPYTREQTIHYLRYLARQLEQQGQSEFYLERLQVEWLPPTRWRWLYPAVTVGLIYGLFFALIKGLNYIFMQGSDQMGRQFTPVRGALDGLAIGVLNTFLFILLNGLIFGVLDEWIKQRQAAKLETSLGQMREIPSHAIIRFLQNRIVYGLIFGILNGILITILVDSGAGVPNGLFVTIVYFALGRMDKHIKPAEELHWSWKLVGQKIIKYGGNGMLLGLGYGLIIAFQWQFSISSGILGPSRLLPCLLFGLGVGLIFGLLFVLIRGLSYSEIKEKEHWRVNQGIWNSVRNSMLLGLLFWFATGLCFALVEGLLLNWIFQQFHVPYAEYSVHFPKSNGLVLGMVNGLVLGSLIWLSNGGIACVQHVTIRCLLCSERSIPWHYPRFLEHAARHVLLRRVSNGYMFTHRLLQQYFASLEEDKV